MKPEIVLKYKDASDMCLTVYATDTGKIKIIIHGNHLNFSDADNAYVEMDYKDLAFICDDLQELAEAVEKGNRLG